jgi:hypothetical protein
MSGWQRFTAVKARVRAREESSVTAYDPGLNKIRVFERI